jgi:hypothetical protein
MFAVVGAIRWVRERPARISVWVATDIEMRLPAPLDYRDVIETLKGWGVVRGGFNAQRRSTLAQQDNLLAGISKTGTRRSGTNVIVGF